MSTAKKGKKKSTAKRGSASKIAYPEIPHAPDCLITSDFERTRSKLLTLNTPLPREKDSIDNPCIVYWMMRDVRTIDNWALLFAQSLAVQKEVPLRVVYTLSPPPDVEASEGEDGAPPTPADMPLTLRHGTFLLDGLRVVADELTAVEVPFDVLCPSSRSLVGESIRSYCTTPSHDALAVVCDMSPLRHPRQWTEKQAAPLLEEKGIPLYQVDAHNIVPVWIASPKREVGARTLRPKIHKVFSDYCTHFPEFKGNSHVEKEEVSWGKGSHDWDQYRKFMNLDESIGNVNGMKAGHEVAMARFNGFCSSKQDGLKNFDSLRNDPNYSSVCSNLSPWINFGQVSFQRLALDVRALKKHSNGTAAYIEEGVIRRELSDNFVYYTPDGYDSLAGAAEWARDSLELHRSDEREHLYTWKELERGMTRDDLWNAAQLQLVREGGMHGFMRMYWAKKILEWTVSPACALATAQYFNDRFAYDGNDPNGFVGVSWSIMGIHDMGWKERPIFGKIRFMNYAGCKRKFKIAQFVARYEGAAENAAKVSGTKSGAEKISGKKRKT
eukprot:CAMPEP_0201869092 /NCGR_PEP_ID=MMETSP0902-20130614/2737_1 /ASSEMBLY_ACC=CAM_ASM_000551 /TAXON_ID=420261 /ORGANISM="Thalassiosira antarctica, Strain CCMP982" /LENGTH=553 /DNA_ID=CAMNT_0048394535 /DNA_START=273 /DNA_END=1934 /DNA_ORIENTATION=+